MLKKLLGLGKASAGATDNPLGIDPAMRYCPTCGDEYRADIVSCAGCGVDLISGAQRLAAEKAKSAAFYSRTMELGQDEPRVVIRDGKLRELKSDQVLLTRVRIPTVLTAVAGGASRSG
ncbi:MAG: hypothetical protein ACK5PS_01895 [Desulfopila sp.]